MCQDPLKSRTLPCWTGGLDRIPNFGLVGELDRMSINRALTTVNTGAWWLRFKPSSRAKGTARIWQLASSSGKYFALSDSGFIVINRSCSICECGYIPAALFTITRFYKQEETSKRFGIFFVGNMAANGAAGLLAFGM